MSSPRSISARSLPGSDILPVGISLSARSPIGLAGDVSLPNVSFEPEPEVFLDPDGFSGMVGVSGVVGISGFDGSSGLSCAVVRTLTAVTYARSLLFNGRNTAIIWLSPSFPVFFTSVSPDVSTFTLSPHRTSTEVCSYPVRSSVLPSERTPVSFNSAWSFFVRSITPSFTGLPSARSSTYLRSASRSSNAPFWNETSFFVSFPAWSFARMVNVRFHSVWFSGRISSTRNCP